MAGRKRKGAKAGAKLGAKAGVRVAPMVGKAAGKAAWKVGKGQAKLVRAAASSREPKGARYLKYGFFALLGLVVGAILSRAGSKEGASSSYTDGTGHHAPDADSPAGQRGQTWGSGTPTGTAGGGDASTHQQPTDPNRTGAERDYSDPASGPLIGEHHSAGAGGVDEEQDEVEQRIRSRVGEDPRTAGLPRLNVEVIDGVAELRGVAPSEDAKSAVGEIASETEGVREVRNLLTVS